MTTKSKIIREPFTPTARLMVLLGDQLIRNSALAVFELVKNAYDADAHECSISLVNIHLKGKEKIIVRDDGSGMTLETIISEWLRPGTRMRLTQREKMLKSTRRSRKHGRLPLGEKGVGRFAVHKLGDRIQLVTRAKSSDEVVVDIDWREFESDKPLKDVRVRIHERVPELFEGNSTGTQIVVTDFREGPWTKGQVRNLHRAVTSICSPLDSPASFKAYISLNPDPDRWLMDLLSSDQIRKYALFEFRGEIDENGLKYNYKFQPPSHWKGVVKREVVHKRSQIPPPDKRSLQESMPLFEDIATKSDPAELWRKAGLGSVSIKFDIFDLDRKTLSALEADPKGLKEYLNQNGGVRVYRDGVRVYDFGEPGNDWLNLGGKRINVPTKRIGNNQILGEIQLNLRESTGLVEQTNREGFVENAAFQLFRHAVEYAVTQAQIERNIDKTRIRTSEQTDRKKDREPVLDDLSRLRDDIFELAISESNKTRLMRYIEQIDVQYREVLERLLTAAASGLNLTLVIHEIEKGIRTLYKAISDVKSHDHVLTLARHLADQIDSITWLLRQGRPAKVKSSDLIKHVKFAWESRFIAHKINFLQGIPLESPDITVKCNRRLTMSALMNLVDNSIYWTGTLARNRKIWVGTSLDLEEGPAIIVADNGPGMTDAPEYLTAPFFTRKPDGMGLGLHLAHEIMKSQQGRLDFPEPSDVTLPDGIRGAVVAMIFRGG